MALAIGGALDMQRFRFLLNDHIRVEALGKLAFGPFNRYQIIWLYDNLHTFWQGKRFSADPRHKERYLSGMQI
jgi:hypothetical protein